MKSPRAQKRWRRYRRLHVLEKSPEFADAFHRHAVLFPDVAEQRLRQTLFLLVVKTELDGVVTSLPGLRFDLQARGSVRRSTTVTGIRFPPAV